MAVRVLIVDDDRLFVETLSLLIGKHPILEVAATASSTLEIDFLMGFARAEPPFDAAVVDFHLAGSTTGDEVVSTILRFFPSIVVVGLTGDPDGRAAMLRAGAADVLMKDEIVERLFAALGGGGDGTRTVAYSVSRPASSSPASQ